MNQQLLNIYEFGPYRIDAAKRLLLRHGEVVPLTPKCFEILLALVERSGEVVDKEGLMNRVWPDSFVEEGNLTYNISILRKALGERPGEHQYIVTVPGRGYQFVAGVRAVSPDSSEEAGPHLTPTNHIVQAKANGNHQEAVLVPEAARARSFNESSLSGVYNIWAQPLDGGAPRQLTNFATDQIFAYAWSRDGKLLACARGNQNSDVVLISDIR